MIGPRITWVLANSGAGTSIQLKSTWDATEQSVKNKSYRRTYGGRLHTFTLVQSFQEWALPCDFVSSSHASWINSWWSSQEEVYLTINGSFDTSIFTADTYSNIPVRIFNQSKPFDQHAQNRYDLFAGIIRLGTT